MANRKAGPVWAPSPLGLSTWTCRLRVFSPGPFLSACVARFAGSWQRPVARPLDPAHNSGPIYNQKSSLSGWKALDLTSVSASCSGAKVMLLCYAVYQDKPQEETRTEQRAPRAAVLKRFDDTVKLAGMHPVLEVGRPAISPSARTKSPTYPDCELIKRNAAASGGALSRTQI